MKILALLLLGVSLSKAGPESRYALVPEGLQEGSLPTCIHDNLDIIFIDKRHSSSASAFCSNFLAGTSRSTTVAKATVDPYARVSDASSTVTTVVWVTPTSPDTILTVAPEVKREAVPAAFAPGRAGTYPPDRISSACSCLVSPLVRVRQVAASTSTQNWTRHFTRLMATVETTISIPTFAARTSSAISHASVSSASVATTSMIISIQSSSIALSDSARTTSLAAVSTTADAASPTTSASTEQPPPAPPSYCTDGYFLGPVDDEQFTTQCGLSYVPASPDPSTVNTSDSYMDCAALCDSDDSCIVFSYLLTAVADNCYLFDSLLDANSPPTSDPNVNSGARDD